MYELNNIERDFLFNKHVLVSNFGENQVASLYTLRNKLNIKITEGFELANPDLIEFAASRLGEYVPAPFYQGFPQSVRSLTNDQLLFDQLVHYTVTYGFGDFEEAGHSVFEHVLDRSEFSEHDEPKEFRILDEEAATKYLLEMLGNLLNSSRPLNPTDVSMIIERIKGGWFPKQVASKQVACELLLFTGDTRFCRFLDLPDFIRFVDTVNWKKHCSEHINRLRLTNQERKLVTKVLDTLLLREADMGTMMRCVEKRDAWKGILHHIHYCPKTEDAKAAIELIYNDDFRSFYSTFEKGMKSPTMSRMFLAQTLKSAKGNGTLLRNLNWLLYSAQDVKDVINVVDAKNPLILLQMQNMYRNYEEGPRTFRFTKNERIHSHKEEERKHTLSRSVRDQVVSALEDKLRESLSGKVGKVYIAPGMEKIAVPVNMSAGESGFGIMPTGSRIALPKGKKIRAFTYWEKVNDIDLACFGIDEDGERTEFSWRTMCRNQSDAITYSGDETSGYNGGSEYFDVDLDALKEKYPTMKYMVFTNNVYSGKEFHEVTCRAGWMSRDILDSGEIYEPKTVKSAYKIDAKTTFCYLYAIDVEKREVIWLNIADARNHRVAGAAEFDWMNSYFTMCDTMNMRKLFEYAGEVVDDPAEAELVVGDIRTDKPQIHSYEFEKALSYLS